MTTYRTYYPNTVTVVSRGTGYAGWGNQNNVKALDGVTAYSTVNSFIASNYLQCTKYQIQVADNEVLVSVVANITAKGIKVLIGPQMILQPVADETVKIIINGSMAGNNLAIDDIWQDTFATRQYGGSGWGVTITKADVIADNFGISYAVKPVGMYYPMQQIDVDAISITIGVEELAPGHPWIPSQLGQHANILGV